ncbi:hypothetical protein [Actinomadura sp. BRA 177]|uniref:hypothetical protein n=1 Tax=Actinomadura sp. BRA 177 TaxID=2745202 RepID=UPI0015960628|nr:hypothetical protein [Actinomadura sp. BRA 177]NVI91729.1 hypothetical protein [Actinomadura sp. BRA 177]
MRQTIIVAAVALIAAVVAVAGAITFIKLDSGESHDAGRAANHTSAPPAQTPAQKQAPPAPRPTVTITRPPQNAAPPAYGDADANFLAMIAADGITAPDGWAIEAGNATCGQDYASARGYLTDGGLYDYHVQTFLDDWTLTHGGC